MDEPILFQRDDAVVTVTLNRPERRNACDLAMWRRLGEVMDELRGDDRLRCVVIRGAGGEAFGAGADIAEFQQTRYSADQAREYNRQMTPALHGLRDCPHPVIALIEGACMGGGLEIAMFCDLRIAGQGARFGIPVKRLGHILALPELEELVDLVGRANALELLLEGRIWTADEAYVKGLATRVVADAEVEQEAYGTAKRIAEGAPIAARGHKVFARRVKDPAPLTAEELDEPFRACDTEDYKEGIRAFLAKAKPRFKGR